MEVKKCKSKKCQRELPEDYKYKYCENCRTKWIGWVKQIGVTVVSIVVMIGVAILEKIIKPRNN